MATSSHGSTARSAARPLSVSEWFRTRCRPLPWVLGASLLASGFHGEWLSAAEPDMSPSWIAQPGKQTKDKEGATPTIGPKVKLQYTAATWEKVLRDLAEGTDSQLIADRVPMGRYSRRDAAQYSRADAVRIINREIEPLGFRIIEKGQFLIVLDLPSQRPRYQPAVTPRSTQHEPQPTEEVAAPVAPQRQFSKVTPGQRNTAQQPPVAPRGRANVQQMSHEEPAALPEENAAARRHLLDAEGTAPASNEPMSTVVFRARNQRAAELAKRVFRTFRDRAELVDAGRNGLPAFRVRQVNSTTAQAPVVFSMAIDEEREELLIDARAKEADGLLKLLRRLDTPILDSDPIQLVSSSKTVCEIAPQLPAEFARIRALRDKVAARQPDAFAQAEDPLAQDPAQPNLPARPTAQDVVGNIKGDVSIEAVEDLGVLILRGNEADIAKVMEVIRELEKLSEATAPKVHLLYLKHVNSEALAELLTTVYESLTKFPGKATQPRQNVAILPVVKPNAVLIVAPANDLEAILQLADQLDEQTDPETEFEVFRLKSGNAERIAQTITETYVDDEPAGLETRIIVRADVRTNSIFVRGKPRDLDEIGSVIKKLDQEATDTVSRMQVFKLKNAVATELAAVLNAAIQSVLAPPSNAGASQVFGNQAGGTGGQIAEGFRDVSSRVLEILAVDAEGEKKLRSGILADIRITPDPRSNTLNVIAPEASLSLIAELIKQLDQPTNLIAEIKVFTLANADAELMVQQLQGLFNAQTTGAGAQGAQQRAQALGVQVAGAEDASSGLIPLRFSVDTRTNSVIAIGAADALGVVEAIMLRLDESDIRDRKQSVYRLKNSPATNIATSVTTFLTNQQNLSQQDPNLVSTIEQLEREVIVVAEPVSNSLLISATPRYYDEVLKIIQKLDEAPQQVIMQALIVEVELQDTDEFGIELGFQDSILFDRSVLEAPVLGPATTTTAPNGVQTTTQQTISQSSSPGFLFGNPNTPLGNNVGSGNPTNAVGTQGLSNFSLGRVNGDLGFGGLVLSASSESVSALLRALAQNRQVRVLSRPQIRAMDNQVALIQQGQDVPVVNGVTQNGLTTNPQIIRQQAGVILQVTPRISPDGNIVMAIQAEKSQYQLGPGTGVPIFTDASTGNVIESPVKDISLAQTTISVPNGQTVVLGGLITSRTDVVHRRVPWLGDIPVVGWAFRYDFNQTRRTELLIFLTPRIITDDAESEHIKEVEMARLHFVESEAEEMHGPLRGVPADQLFDGQIPGPGGEPYCPPEGVPLPSTPVRTMPTPIAPQPVVPQSVAPPAPPPAGLGGESIPPADVAPPPQSGTLSDPQFIPAGGGETSGASVDRRVQQAGLIAADKPATVKIRKSSAAATEPPSTIRLGKDRPEKKSWFSRK